MTNTALSGTMYDIDGAQHFLSCFTSQQKHHLHSSSPSFSGHRQTWPA
jgi:hypothetical protein